MAWTEDRVETLKKLWMDGLSASQIALELGGVTRNAVIGKVHRLGLSGRGKTSTSSRPRQPRASQTTSRPRTQTGGTVGNAALKMTPDASPDIAPAPRPQRFEELVIPITERANIMQLNENTCRWPIGDPTEDGFHFCGRKADDGVPYCSYHRRIAYQPMADRRREKRAAAG
ncbi:MAG: GcrA family cell cycle regulator [Pseudomonadota bacterium]